MKNIQKLTPFIFLVLLSSCGLVEKFKTPEEPTQAGSEGQEVASTPTPSDEDSFFSEAFNEANTSEASELTKDAPNNIASSDSPSSEVKSDLDALEQEFDSDRPAASTVAESKPAPINEDIPIKIKEESKTQAASFSGSSYLTTELDSYTVNRGETLMQISFKLYGDLSKWKMLKDLNNDKLSATGLKRGMKLNYYVPETKFTWNPEGTPYLIRNGDTLGTISSSVYNTPKKWKKIWDNNRPLIKNPNKIYAGFTLYYLSEGLADANSNRENYVEKTEVDKQAEREMAAVKQLKKIAKPKMHVVNANTPAEDTAMDENEQILTVAPIENTVSKKAVTEDELMGEIETLNAQELTKADRESMSEIEELANMKEEVSSSQSAIRK